MVASRETRIYYVGRNEGYWGPLTLIEVFQKLQAGEIAWLDFYWVDGTPHEWQRLCDHPELKTKLPPNPTARLIRRLKELEVFKKQGMSATAIKNLWFLRFQNEEYGPFKTEEVIAILEADKFGSPLFAWHEGIDHWLPIEKTPKFSEVAEKRRIAKEKAKTGKRLAQRFQFAATAHYTMSGDLRESALIYNGTCKDISLSGACILSKDIPGAANTLILLEIRPSPESGILPFSCMAIIVRILPDKSGFAVRFKQELAPALFEQIIRNQRR